MLLAEALKSNFTLKSLRLKENSMKDQAGEELIEALRYRMNITELVVDENPIGLSCQRKLNNFVRKNRSSSGRLVIPRLRETVENGRFDFKQTNEVTSLALRTKTQEQVLRSQVFFKRQEYKIMRKAETKKGSEYRRIYDDLRNKGRTAGNQIDELNTEKSRKQILHKREMRLEENQSNSVVVETRRLEKESNF